MIIISYDIADDKLRNQFSKYLCRFGYRLQYSVYQIKHSNKIVKEYQAQHLLDEDKCKTIEARYGEITGKYVLYRGKNEKFFDVEYLNVEKLLESNKGLRW